MKQKWFVLSAIVAIAVIGVFVFEHATAQRPERGERGERGERSERGERGERSPRGMMNMDATSLIDNSWLDLTFRVQVDDETLVQARPIHQAARETLTTKMKALGEKMQKFRDDPNRGDIRTVMQEMYQERQTIVASVGKEFQTSLKEVLSEEELTKLNELTKERLIAEQERRNRFRGGQGGQRGGQGGQR